VNFEYQSAELQPRCAAKIAALAAWMQSNTPDALVALDGHKEAADDGNKGLAAERVKAVRDALVAAGVGPDRISIGSYGAQAEVCPSRPAGVPRPEPTGGDPRQTVRRLGAPSWWAERDAPPARAVGSFASYRGRTD